MPIINGKKMACEPCIRGHRSTKCNHQNDRMMIEVRKPGRPLSTCPHPLGKNCVCGGVAALPRRGKCACPTQGTSRLPIKNEDTADGIPMIPETNPPYRVQRAGSRVAKHGSFNPVGVAGLARMDPNQFNISSYATAPVPLPGPATATVFMPQFNDPFSQEWQVGLQPQQLAFQPGPVVSGPGSQPGPTDPTFYAFPNEAGDISPSISPPNLSRKSSQSSTDSKPVTYTPSSSPGSASRVLVQAGEQGGCCGTTMQEPDTRPVVPHDQTQQANGNTMTLPYRPTTNIYDASVQQQNIITFPPGVGTPNNPLQYSQYQMYACAPTANTSYAAAQTLPISPGFDGNFHEAGTTHVCSCGDACECANCIQHPYNRTNMNEWNSANNAMLYQESSNTTTEMFESTVDGNANQHSNPTLSDETIRPTSVRTSDTDTPNGDVEVPSADYFFVRMDGCVGSKDSCFCGSDCACLGCLVHGEGNASS